MGSKKAQICCARRDNAQVIFKINARIAAAKPAPDVGVEDGIYQELNLQVIREAFSLLARSNASSS